MQGLKLNHVSKRGHWLQYHSLYTITKWFIDDTDHILYKVVEKNTHGLAVNCNPYMVQKQ